MGVFSGCFPSKRGVRACVRARERGSGQGHGQGRALGRCGRGWSRNARHFGWAEALLLTSLAVVEARGCGAVLTASPPPRASSSRVASPRVASPRAVVFFSRRRSSAHSASGLRRRRAGAAGGRLTCACTPSRSRARATKRVGRRPIKRAAMALAWTAAARAHVAALLNASTLVGALAATAIFAVALMVVYVRRRRTLAPVRAPLTRFDESATLLLSVRLGTSPAVAVVGAADAADAHARRRIAHAAGRHEHARRPAWTAGGWTASFPANCWRS